MRDAVAGAARYASPRNKPEQYVEPLSRGRRYTVYRSHAVSTGGRGWYSEEGVRCVSRQAQLCCRGARLEG